MKNKNNILRIKQLLIDKIEKIYKKESFLFIICSLIINNNLYTANIEDKYNNLISSYFQYNQKNSIKKIEYCIGENNNTNKNIFLSVKICQQNDLISCGLWSIAHAIAIDLSYHKKNRDNKIDIEECKKYAQIIFDNLKKSINLKSQLSNDNIYNIIQNNIQINNKIIHLKNIYILQIQDDKIICHNIIKKLEKEDKISEFQEEQCKLFSNIKNNQNINIHCICHLATRGHWILISRIKKDNNENIIIKVDSSSIQNDNPNILAYIEFIKNNFTEA